MKFLRFMSSVSCMGLVILTLQLAGCQSIQDENTTIAKTDQPVIPPETVPAKPAKKPTTFPPRETTQTADTNPTPTPAGDTAQSATPAQPAAPAQPEQPLLSNQQIDRYLAEGQVTYERAAKLRYREAVRAGQVKTKADHSYWSTVTEIYRNWDNRYISWDEVQKRLAAAEAAHQNQ